MRKITVMFYSATGTSRRIAEVAGSALARELGGLAPPAAHDLLRRPLKEEANFADDEVLVMAMPVYSGRVPGPLLSGLKKLRGQNTPALILAAYGDRAYDDALLELADQLKERGFVVIGAGAFVARHAVFPRYAVGRPDEKDLAVVDELARRCAKKLESGRVFKPGELVIKGSRPYVKPQELPIYPLPGRECKACGACARVCPVGAIVSSRFKDRPEGCIACAACIHACPQQTRKFRGALYNGLDVLFLLLSLRKKSPRKDPDIFV